MKNNHEIILKQYAAYCKEQPLYLGTAGSYGMEMLTIIREDVWAEYDILAAFHPPVGAAVQVRVGANNQIGVPIEATAEKGMGEIVFAGYKEGVRQIAVDVLYKVAPSSGASGTEPAEPTPDVVQQILSAASNAEKIAKSVRADAEKIKARLDEIPKIDDTAITTTSLWSSKQIVDTLCPPIEETGNPVVCYPVAGYPLGVKAKWEPVQEGSGTPSPENIRPIKGRDSVTITQQEDNQVITLTLPETVYGGEVDAVTGEGINEWKSITLDGTETWSYELTNISGKVGFLLRAKDIQTPTTPDQKGQIVCNKYVTRSANDTYTTKTGISIEAGNNKYFRIYDEVHADKDVASWKAYLAAQYAAGTPVQIAYKLKEPVPFTAAGAQPIPALSGTNTLLTDADSVSVSGRADLNHIIRKMQEK
ncbi:hypothetical protein [Hominenteromicrobium sp.]|uniref:hypothetical protein n=1 Tax=Hominenteromicrobium sp. TaxID=3073581 RepID=UPI003AF05D4B